VRMGACKAMKANRSCLEGVERDCGGPQASSATNLSSDDSIRPGGSICCCFNRRESSPSEGGQHGRLGEGNDKRDDDHDGGRQQNRR
jgi:hypothetical protein